MLIPILNILFGLVKQEPVTVPPEFHFSIDYLTGIFNYYFYLMVQEYGKFYGLAFVCGIILICSFLSNTFRYLSVKILIGVRLRIMKNLREELYKKYVTQSPAFFSSRKKGDLLSVMMGEVQEIESSLINALQVLMRDPFVIVIYFIVLFYLSPQLTLFTLIFFPVSALAISFLSKKLKKIGYFSQELLGQVMSFTEETLSGIKVIQSFVAEKFMMKRFNEINKEFANKSSSMFSRRELASPVSEVMGVMIVIGLVMYGGYLVTHNDSALTGSMFITYLALYSQMIQPFKNLSSTTTSTQRGIVAAEKIFALIDAPNPITEKQNSKSIAAFTDSIEFKNVRFRYNQNDVLKNINLKIEKGKRIALVGQSGAGKTTLADLVPRFYDVTEGEILIDGINVKDLKIENLRGLMGMVTQDTMLFNDTVFNNIAFTKRDAAQQDIQHAAEIANAHSFISQLENGYQSLIGDRGMKLSGGQRQRVTIARAIFKNPSILILDEATSALDTENEKLVQEALDKLMTNRTSIVIAHRLSTIQHADEIIVMKEGEIIERGTHQSLMTQNGHYRRLVDMQMF